MLKNTKTFFKILALFAFALMAMVYPSYAQAQGVDCPATDEEYWELYLTHTEEEIRKVALTCMEGMGSEGAEAAASTDESEAAQPIDERKQVDLEKGIVTLVPADYTCVGDVSLDGQKKYDSDGNTGMVVYLLEETPVTADFGTVTCWPGNISADADTQQRAEGCDADGCGNMQMMEWPEEATTAATASPQEVNSNVDLGQIPSPIDVRQQGAWTVYEIAEIDEGEDHIVGQWVSRLQNPAPQLWPTYPNVENKLVPEFPHQPCPDNPNVVCVPAGVEYGVPNVPFCQQDQRCDFVVPAWHYRLITADYTFQGMECRNTDDSQKGCLLLLINVMDKSYTWRNQIADNGFTVAGRYWDGDRLEWGVWGLVSHTSANMLNMRTYRNPLQGDVLNSGDGANAGANCGTVEGCPSVDATVVIHAGDRILAIMKTTVSRPQK